MGRRDARHGSGRALRWFPVVLVLAILVAATATYRFDLSERWFGRGAPDPSTDPAAVPPPEGLSLPPLTPPDAVARALDAADGVLDPARVRRALASRLDPGLCRVKVGKGADWSVARSRAKKIPAGVHDLVVTQVGAEPVEVDWISFR